MASKTQKIQAQNDEEPEAVSLQNELEALDLDESANAFFETIITQIENVQASADAADRLAGSALSKCNKLKDEIAQLEEENAELRSQLTEIENRTNLLEVVNKSTSSVVEKRAAVLIQVLFNEAWEKKKKNLDNVEPMASMDYKAAKTALGGTITARQQLYDAMRKAVKIVHGEDLPEDELDDPSLTIRFIKESKTSEKNTRLLIDLNSVNEIQLTTGDTITPPGGIDQ